MSKQTTHANGVTEITVEFFEYALNVLPPGKWGHYAGGEAFYVTERISGNEVSWYFCVAGRYFTLDDNAALHPSVLLPRVAEYIRAYPQTTIETAPAVA